MRRNLAVATMALVSGLGIRYFARSSGAYAAQGAETRAADLAAIEKLHRVDIDATLSQDPKGLIDIWTEDAVRFNPAGPTAVCRQAIAVENQNFHAQHPGFKVLSYVPKYKNLQVKEGLACEWFEREGEYKLSADAPPAKWHAKGLEALKRQSDGSWKFALIINSE
jgi:ketosteroid isomerase-like protein